MSIPSSRHLRHGLVAAVAAATFGCGARAQAGGTSTQDDLEAVASSAQASHIAYLVIAPVASQDPALAAVNAAAAWPSPASSCVSRSWNPGTNVVTLTFADCAGPFGLASLSGDVLVTFSANPNGTLHVESQSDRLSVSGAPVSFAAAADVTVSGTMRNVGWHANWRREDSRGETIAHVSDATIVIDAVARCRDSNGAAVTTIGSREIDTKVEDYGICVWPDGVEACPSGALVQTHVDTGETVTMIFDGTDVATEQTPAGTVHVSLPCGS